MEHILDSTVDGQVDGVSATKRHVTLQEKLLLLVLSVAGGGVSGWLDAIHRQTDDGG